LNSATPFLIYFVAVITLVALILSLSYFLGQKHRQRAMGEPYECGVISEGSARLRLPVQFYLMALFFVIFDLESIFIFAWAISFRELGWAGYFEVLIFIGILIAALFYLWKLGALNWGTSRSRSYTWHGHRIEPKKMETLP